MDSDRSHAESWTFESHNEADTERLGHALANSLEPGTVVALCGPLGSGKTRLAQAIAEGLGIDRAEVTSPTFSLINRHDGRLAVHHFDTYRLRDVDEFLELGSAELMESDDVCLIEWADRFPEALPRDLLWITLESRGTSTRIVDLAGTGDRSKSVLHRCRATMEDAVD